MVQRFKILIGLCVFLLIGLFIIQIPLFQPPQSIADETPTETPIPTDTPTPTNTPTPTPYYFGCEGLTCKKIAGSSSDTCNPLHENQSCYSYTWSPIPPNWGCNVSCGPGNEYRSCLCSGGAQECCPQCSAGYGCDSTLGGSSCCVSQAPNFPTITEIKDGYGQIVYQSSPYVNYLDKLQTKIITIKWSFNDPDTGDGCGKSWGYLCPANSPYSPYANSDSFKIKINNNVVSKTTTDREYTTNETDQTLIPNGSVTIKVCANNGDDDLESCATVSTVKAIPTGYIAGYLGEYDSDTGTSYGAGGNDPIKLKLYVGAPWATPPPHISTDCTVTTESRYVTPKPNDPINPPPKPIGTFYSCTITYDDDSYPGGEDIPQSEFIKKFYLGPASTTSYDDKLYCINPTPKVDGSFDNCSICLGQADCTSTEAMSCSDINPTTTPPYQRLTPTPILVWTSAGSCREDAFTGEMNFNQSFNSLTPTPDVIRYKNIVFQINQHNTFFKQKNTAFQSHAIVENHIPASNDPFSSSEAEDDGTSFMIIGEPDDTSDTDQLQYSHLSGTGLVLSTINNGSASISKLGWSASYTPTTRMNAQDYYNYTKARKNYLTVTDIVETEIKHRGCYIHDGAFDYTGQVVASHPIVFISSDTVTIKSNLNPASSIIFIAPKIVFNNNVTSVKGVFIANEISVVSEKEADGVTAIPESYYLTNIINKPLLVTGNLVALDENKPIKYWLRKLDDNRQPSLFVKFDVKQYTDGMPCLGVSKYKWNQLQ